SSAVIMRTGFAVSNEACEHGAGDSSSPSTTSHPVHTPSRSARARIVTIILERSGKREADVAAVDHRRDDSLFCALVSRRTEVQPGRARHRADADYEDRRAAVAGDVLPAL